MDCQIISSHIYLEFYIPAYNHHDGRFVDQHISGDLMHDDRSIYQNQIQRLYRKQISRLTLSNGMNPRTFAKHSKDFNRKFLFFPDHYRKKSYALLKMSKIGCCNKQNHDRNPRRSFPSLDDILFYSNSSNIISTQEDFIGFYHIWMIMNLSIQYKYFNFINYIFDDFVRYPNLFWTSIEFYIISITLVLSRFMMIIR